MAAAGSNLVAKGPGGCRRTAAPWARVGLAVFAVLLASDVAASPRYSVVRVDEAPEIDGRLDDAVWQKAPLLGPLTQVEPVEGAAPSERTEVRLLSDGRHLYFGVRAFDREPEKIIAKEMLRDRSLTNDDRIAIVLDTYLDRRNAFFFQINPNGAIRDALIENNRVFIPEWDGIWSVQARRDELGWTVEIRIPYSTLTFDPDKTAWGFNILRSVRRRNETARWSSARLDKSFIDVSELGVLDGMSGLDAGRGIDFRPQQAVSYKRDRPDDERSVRLDPGFDLFFRATPSMKGVLTVNPDFSDAPVDDRRVNLSRFGLFFPETRDFFLEESGIFEFGDLEENGRPFFSRRVGLAG
ncbi:MAG: carbohydrate binding family 9 domain-containing protein, partial [Deltaproteobacteria bacterium]|nr:carbohydrate binding family 9 domain-containing protein [Deltaproteobacteria bacterium]